MKFDLDLARASPRPTWFGWVLLLLGGLTVVIAGMRYETESVRLAEAEAMLKKYVQPTAPTNLPVVASAAVRQRNKAVEAEDALALNARRLLDADWSYLLNTLEDLQSDDIALIGVKASVAGNQLRSDPLALTGNARSLGAMFAYAESLQKAGFTRVALDNHALQDDAGENVVRFSVQAGWDDPVTSGAGTR